MNGSSEPYGTTPLPTSSSGSPVRIFFDTESVLEKAQQPQSQEMALYEATPYDDCINGHRMDVNQHFALYSVKNGLIRVLHRQSTLRSLLRAHQDQKVTDIQFFQEGDVVATVGTGNGNSTVIIWRIFIRSPEIMSEKLLEVKTTAFQISRVIWHPFNPNQFWMLHNDERGVQVATLVESTRIATSQHPTENHAVCEFFSEHVIMQGAMELKASSLKNMTDLCWSPRDTRHILTTHESGHVCLWDLRKLQANTDGTVSPERLATIMEDSPVSRCLFMPHENIPSRVNTDTWTPCFLTSSENNSTITLWSPFGPDCLPTKVQVLGLERSAANYLVDICYGPAPADASPPSCFILQADRTAGKLLAFHCRALWNEATGKSKMALLQGCDYVVPFTTKYPTYCWKVISAPTTDISEEELYEQGSLIFDMKVYAYQSKVIQCITLTSYMCLPPENSWTDPTPGVRVQRLLNVHSAHVSEVGSEQSDGVEYDEEYDVEDVEEDDFDAPEPSSLPTPSGLGSPQSKPTATNSLVNNPFANWLGAIAAKTTTTASTTKASDTTPVAPPASDLPSPVANTAQPFLSPKDFEGNSNNIKKEASRDVTPISENRGEKKKKGKAKKESQPPPTAEVKILKREEEPPLSSIPNQTGSAATIISQSKVSGIDTSNLTHDIRIAVRDEMRAVLLPAVHQAVHESLNESVINPIQASINRLSSQGINIDHAKLSTSLSQSVDKPLRAAFAESVRNVMIPTLESVTGQIFEQISEKLDNGSLSSSSSPELGAVSAQLSRLTELVSKLSTEVQSLKASMAVQPPILPVAAPVAAPVMSPAAADPRNELLPLLKAGQYQAAFTKALSYGSVDLVIFCCSNVDVNDVLDKPDLSQPIILCLIQQLGSVIAKEGDLDLLITWLQEMAYTLNPGDESIQRHVPQVLKQLVTNINTRLGTSDQQMQRRLQRLLKIIRGMQMG